MDTSDHDINLLVGCFNDNGTPRDRNTAVWQYHRNPANQLFVDFAIAGDRVAAIYATLPVMFRIRGSARLGVQSLDTITDANFRGVGLFKRLATSVFERAANNDCALIYGFPNKNSAHGFFERLGWSKLDPVPFMIRPLRSRYVLKRLGLDRFTDVLPDIKLTRSADVAVEVVARFDERFTALWQSFAKDIGIAVERNAAYLNWRISDKPGERYTTLAVVERGRARAFVTFAVKDKHGARIGYLMEALCDGRSSQPALRRLLNRALCAMASDGAEISLAWCMPHSPNFWAHVRAGFMPFPERLRPIELHFGARAFDASLAGDIQNRRAWYLSYLDSDTV